jgi:hypothetical protein
MLKNIIFFLYVIFTPFVAIGSVNDTIVIQQKIGKVI